jgi:hypothetical protein
MLLTLRDRLIPPFAVWWRITEYEDVSWLNETVNAEVTDVAQKRHGFGLIHWQWL